ncbi:sal protein 1-like [Tropilaelaps mercedesae]|uniref:Sal protein 1-like n=1 Tax=Tropilaelaps mercedesae TaxID=418985 RepID=A0A1V9WYN7_9ACAR|nr:sal protein 1-like [Tropilaelaps mercedesae]
MLSSPELTRSRFVHPSSPPERRLHCVEQRRRYSCPECGRLFTAKNNMKRHQQVHQPVRVKHTCPLCDKRFSWEQDLKVHIRMRHPDQLVDQTLYVDDAATSEALQRKQSSIICLVRVSNDTRTSSLPCDEPAMPDRVSHACVAFLIVRLALAVCSSATILRTASVPVPIPSAGLVDERLTQRKNGLGGRLVAPDSGSWGSAVELPQRR